MQGSPNLLCRTLKLSSQNVQHVNDLDLIFKVMWLFIEIFLYIHDSSRMECARITKPSTWDPLVQFWKMSAYD